MSLTVGLILGQQMAKKDTDISQALSSIEEAVIANGGIIDKAGAIATPEEIIAGIYTILENFPLRMFHLFDTAKLSTLNYQDDGQTAFPNLLPSDNIETVLLKILGYQDEAQVELTTIEGEV